MKTQGAMSVVDEEFWNSVLYTGLLPRWGFGTRGEAYDTSGFAVEHDGTTSDGELTSASVAGGVVQDFAKSRSIRNAPHLKGGTSAPHLYVDEIVEGFCRMYRLLVKHRSELLQPENPLTTLFDRRVRFLFRSTRIYDAILRKLLHPMYLRDGADRSIEIDILSRALTSSTLGPRCWPIVEAERRSLEQMDIPYFSAHPYSDALEVAPETVIPGFFPEPSRDLVVAGLARLNEDDLAKQISFIRASLHCSSANPSSMQLRRRTDTSFVRGERLSSEELTDEALEIAKAIARRAVIGGDGSATWLNIGYRSDARRWQFEPMGCGLYDGLSGVALFLASVEKVTGGSGFRSLALGSVSSVSAAVLDPEFARIAARRFGLGGAVGLGAIIYGMVRISRFLDEPTLVRDAVGVAQLVTAESIGKDERLDVCAGAAGAILGLLALYETCPDRGILERAIACGNRLLEMRTPSGTGPRAWRTVGENLLAGFAHGAAGIAYALARLGQETGQQAFVAAAEEAIRYERNMFRPEVGNWPMFLRLRSGQEPTFMTAWCHGAPGIGLARVGGLPVLSNEQVKEDIETALTTTLRFGIQGIPSLCCGDFGRVECLLVAGQRLSRDEMLEASQAVAARVVREMREGVDTLVWGGPSAEFRPLGFFQGMAGVGYELLRLAHPELLPSVLLWE